MAFRFRLISVDGRDLGERTFGVVQWSAGDLLPIAGSEYLRVVAVDYNPEGDETSGTLTVENV